MVLDRIAPAGRRLAKIRGEDPVAYFGIAHSTLFDHDFNLNNEFDHMPPDGKLWTLTQASTGLPGSPWGLGYSFLEIPLVGLGTGLDALAGNPADGYSHWAVYFYSLGTALFAGCGLVALFFLLREVAAYWKVMPEGAESLYALGLTVILFFASNIGYYAFSEMAHSATFLFASWFLLKWWRVRDSESAKDWLVLGLIGGFFSICRWQDVIELGAPLLAALPPLSNAGKKQGVWWKTRSLYAAGIGICWIPQMLEWKAIYGKYITIPHGGGIFTFPPPHMLQVVFSTQSGWATWTPITLLGFAGLAYGLVRATRIYLPWLVALALQIVLVGSISFWDGMGSFGSRYLISQVPLIGVGVVTLFAVSPARVRKGLAVVSVICAIFTALFAIDFRLDLVPSTTPLTFSELVTDRFRPIQLLERKVSTQQAKVFLDHDNPGLAIEILEPALSLGEDRNVDLYLMQAYRAAGRAEQGDAAEARLKKFLASELY